MMEAQAFAARGARLLDKAAELARTTSGTFDGEAAPVLALARTYAEAARNAFYALGASDELTPEQQRAALALGRRFMESLASLVSRFGTSGVLPPVPGSNASPLATLAAPSSALVQVSPSATSALETLCRDPLTLLGVPKAAMLSLLSVVADGVEVAA